LILKQRLTLVFGLLGQALGFVLNAVADDVWLG
jgi:hypothetical protein